MPMSRLQKRLASLRWHARHGIGPDLLSAMSRISSIRQLVLRSVHKVQEAIAVGSHSTACRRNLFALPNGHADHGLGTSGQSHPRPWLVH